MWTLSAGKGELPADEYSWYCGWQDLEVFWEELVPSRTARVLVPGVGNDATVADMFDAGLLALPCSLVSLLHLKTR